MIRIAHIFTTFYPGPGPMARTFDLAFDQKKKGWQPEFICGYNCSPELIKQKQREGFAVIRIGSLRKYVHPHHDLQALSELVRVLRANKFDIVHTHLAKAGVMGRLAARMAGVKIIIHSVYGATFAPTLPRARNLFFCSLEKLAGKVTDQFIFVGQELCDAYISAGVCPQEKAAVIYGGRDLSHFVQQAARAQEEREPRRQALGIDDETIVLGNVTRIVPLKGLNYALEVVKKLKQQYYKVKLIIVGDAKVPSEKAYRQQLIHQAEELGIQDEVIFTGWVEDTSYYYSVFDFYLLTSLLEGVPGSLIEAAVWGLPIVGFHCYGVREIPGIKARLVPTKDVAGLVSVLKEEISRFPVKDRGGRRVDMAEIQRLQNFFSVSRMMDETARIYHMLLKRKENRWFTKKEFWP